MYKKSWYLVSLNLQNCVKIKVYEVKSVLPYILNAKLTATKAKLVYKLSILKFFERAAKHWEPKFVLKSINYWISRNNI